MNERQRAVAGAPCAAVIFDMDGVIINSEPLWEKARLAVVAEFGGTYHSHVARDVMGLSSAEWSRYLHERVGIPLDAERIEQEVVRQLVAGYHRERPFFPGAIDTVRTIGHRWPAAIASSSSRELIDLVVSLAGLGDVLRYTVSGSDVGRGKPAPDIYLRAAELLGVDPGQCVAIEDSSNGLRAAHNAGMRLIAIPDEAFAPAPDALALADVVLTGIVGLTPAIIDGVFRGDGRSN